jgi:hypothetical protein
MPNTGTGNLPRYAWLPMVAAPPPCGARLSVRHGRARRRIWQAACSGVRDRTYATAPGAHLAATAKCGATPAVAADAGSLPPPDTRIKQPDGQAGAHDAAPSPWSRSGRTATLLVRTGFCAELTCPDIAEGNTPCGQLCTIGHDTITHRSCRTKLETTCCLLINGQRSTRISSAQDGSAQISTGR